MAMTNMLRAIAIKGVNVPTLDLSAPYTAAGQEIVAGPPVIGATTGIGHQVATKVGGLHNDYLIPYTEGFEFRDEVGNCFVELRKQIAETLQALAVGIKPIHIEKEKVE